MILLGPGDEHPLVLVFNRKLGVYPTTEVFSEELASRIRGAQRMLGMEETGLIEDELIRRVL